MILAITDILTLSLTHSLSLPFFYKAYYLLDMEYIFQIYRYAGYYNILGI